MQVEVMRHPLDKVPVSLIVDDSTVLVNMNYFFYRDRDKVEPGKRRWEDLPIVHPESFTREFAEWSLESGVKGKFSVVPCPAAIGRIDEGLPLFTKEQQESWLQMCRELITPAYDITPELITHSYVVDLETCKPTDEMLWEQFDWVALPTEQEDRVCRYLQLSCEILNNVGLTPEGITSPGRMGIETLEFYARLVGEAVRDLTGHSAPYFFVRVLPDEDVDTPVWFPDREQGTATGEIIAGTSDWTGSPVGDGEADPDKFITENLEGGRLMELIEQGDPAVIVSHYQGLYGLHNEDRRGFKTLQVVARRLHELDPAGERIQWRKCSEITNYACAREMADVAVSGNTVSLDLPMQVPDFTLCLTGGEFREVTVDGQRLTRVAGRSAFESGTYYPEGDETLVAFEPTQRKVTLEAVPR